MLKRVFLAASLLALSASATQAATINFDSLGNGVAVTNQFAALGTFSSEAGFTNLTTAQNLGSSLPNFICTGPIGGSIDCTHETILDFTNPVSGLTLLGVGVNDVGVVAQIDVFVNSLFNSTVSVIGTGTPLNPVLVNLGAFSNVTRIRIRNITDAAGIGWDDFTFETGAAAVPEPTTLVLFGSGMIGAYMRRRRKTT